MSVLNCDSLPSPNLLLHWLHSFSFSQQHNYVVLLHSCQQKKSYATVVWRMILFRGCISRVAEIRQECGWYLFHFGSLLYSKVGVWSFAGVVAGHFCILLAMPWRTYLLQAGMAVPVFPTMVMCTTMIRLCSQANQLQDHVPTCRA